MLRTQVGPSSARGVGLVLLALLAVSPGVVPAQNLPTGFAVIAVEPKQLDFGTMERNQTRTLDLNIRNDGGIDLQLLEVIPSCGCTVAEPSTKQVKPGQTALLKVTFSSKEFQGLQQKVIRIKSNDATTPVLEIPLTAMVHVPIVVNPEHMRFDFGRVRRGDASEPRQAYLTAMDIERLELKVLRARDDVYQVAIQPNAEGNPRLAIITVTLKPDAPYGLVSEILRVGTNDPQLPSLDFEVAGDIARDLSVIPSQVNFRYLERGKQVHYELHVQPTVAGVKYKVTGAQLDMPEFKVSFEERIPNQDTAVILRGAPILASDPRAVAAKGRLEGTLRILTNLPDQPELQVKVTYLLRI